MTDALVYIVDDDTGVRDSIGALLDAAGYQSRQYASGDAFLSDLPEQAAGCILLDYSMPGASGLDVLAGLHERSIGLPVVMITAHGDIDLAVTAMKAGAVDFIEKPWDKDALLNTVERIIQRSIEKYDLLEARKSAQAILASFTPREKDVFDELIKGDSNKAIARTLDLSPRTVEVYRKNLLDKSGVSGVAGLVRLAFAARQLEA